jgi:transcriptional regulator with XRE-family HTH domain
MKDAIAQKIKDSFGVTLRKHRHALGISQEELADRAGITVVYVSLLETGKRVPTIVVVFALARGLGMSGADFVTEIEAGT